MNRFLLSVTDFGGLPEQIEAELKPASQACCLASSRDEPTVTGLDWNRHGSRLTAGYSNGQMYVWDVREASIVGSAAFEQPVAHISQAHTTQPRTLVSLMEGPPHIIGPDGPPIPLPVDISGCVRGFLDHRCGYIVIAADKGVLLALHLETYSVLDAIQVAPFRSASFSGKHMTLLLAGAGSVRQVKLCSLKPQHVQRAMPSSAAFNALSQCKAGEPLQSNCEAGALFHTHVEECKDHAGPFKWCSADLTRDGEFICGAAVVKDRHIVHVWQARGSHIAAVLEGPQVGMVACTWHPDSSRLILLSITETGTVLVWAYILAQNWDVYAPGFRILSHNEEYVESETEFDLNPKDDPAAGSQKDTVDPVRCQRVYVGVCVPNDRAVLRRARVDHGRILATVSRQHMPGLPMSSSVGVAFLRVRRMESGHVRRLAHLALGRWLQVDLITIPNDERFLFESDTEDDMKHALFLPPLSVTPEGVGGTSLNMGAGDESYPHAMNATGNKQWR